MKVRKHIYFAGMVQGVGFRYRARWTADRLGLTGWVRNLWDDRVEMEVQGDDRAVSEMLEELEGGSFIRITSVESTDLPLSDNESSFQITD